MSEIDLTDPKLKAAAFTLAEKTPRHLNVPTTPPIHWRLEGEILRVLLADGRTVRAPLAENEVLQKNQMVEVPATHIHDNKKVQPVVKEPSPPKKEPTPPAPVEVPPVHKNPPATPGRIK